MVRYTEEMMQQEPRMVVMKFGTADIGAKS